MITNRVARTAALATFGLAALGAVVLAAPGNADAGSGRTSDSAHSTSNRASSLAHDPRHLPSPETRILDGIHSFETNAQNALNAERVLEVQEIQHALMELQMQKDLVEKFVQQHEQPPTLFFH